MNKLQRSKIKREFKKLDEYIQPFEMRHYGAWIKDYLQALRKTDFDKLAWYDRFGESMRQKIENCHHYAHALRFGFSEIRLNEHGWCENEKFNDYEEIEFRTNQDKYDCNILRLGRGNNDKWTFGYSIEFGMAGKSSGLHVSGDAFNSREEALKAGIDFFKVEFLKAEKQIADRTNYNQAKINAVLKQLNEYFPKQQQLSLF